MQESRRRQYLQLLGVPLWQARNRAAPENNPEMPDNNILNTREPENHQNLDQSSISPELNWTSLEQNVAACMACSLCKTRKQTVFGVGSHQAKLLIIGEAPGAQEDLQGEPFVGRAGQLLDAMLRSINLNRQNIYIANILKCRPPNNRDPEPLEVATCTPFLQQQIALLQPQLILAVGRIAAHYLLNTNTPLSRMRGQQYLYGENRTPLLVTFHPAYLLRSPGEKAKAFEDLLNVAEKIGMGNLAQC